MEYRRRGLVGAAAILLALAVALVGQPAQASAPGGGIQPDVVGGTDAAPGEFPWMVRLSMGCGGAVVASRTVLTAAHCVQRTGKNTKITATIGRTRLSDTSTGEVIRSTYVYRSPSYRTTGTSDWALIELATATTAPTLALVSQGDTSFTGDFTILGWGATVEGGPQSDTLKKATVPFVSDDKCRLAYPDLAADTEICAGYDQGGVDTCQGDSGGPMTQRDASGAWREVGITSYGLGCARAGYPGVCGEVQAFSADISSRISPSGTIIR